MKITPTAIRSERGIFLIECLAYFAIVTVVLAMATAVFFHFWDDSKRLRRNAEDIARALHAGEQWRADVRSSTGPLHEIRQGNFDCLFIPVKTGSINYYFFTTQGAVSRQVGASGKAVTLLEHVKSSQMQREPRQQVTAWRWELELQSGQKKVRMQPLFTFESVANPNFASQIQ